LLNISALHFKYNYTAGLKDFPLLAAKQAKQWQANQKHASSTCMPNSVDPTDRKPH